MHDPQLCTIKFFLLIVRLKIIIFLDNHPPMTTNIKSIRGVFMIDGYIKHADSIMMLLNSANVRAIFVMSCVENR